ncbi:1,4-beta-N-acetylmuramidase [Leuconostoc mesenteroides]|uniref:GH25 family lysozyme n=2 Tax=Leuconostoc mesenteroides TaxID=1245 RepID=UPI000DAAED04|nr:GH25 family lysozyme [Leuconostoc mesenteroides]AWV38418.1 1,4-beta-N-acetylmuramidase [Leuconostoc mesenteroides]QAT28130.1 1,4-beta-N-acetylmuramidase [Leuconostoc mesenteroides]
MNKLKRWVVASFGAVAFFGAMITGVSANTNGIDVANYQGDTTSYFSSFKQAGDNFTMVKLGGRGGGEGAHYSNPKAYAQIHNADAVGMQTGGYFWGQFGDSVSDAQYSAQLAVQDAQNAGLAKGSYIALDYEAGAGVNKANNTTAILTFMDAIYSAGYKPMLYSGAYYMKANIDLSRVNVRYPNALWVASYPTTSHQATPNMNYFPSMSNVKIWQYADNHYGVDGNVMVVGSLDNNKPAEQVASKPSQSTNTPSTPAKTQYATFSGVYVADYWTRYNNKMYGVNFDMSIKPIDYNNYIPISAMTLTDKYGNKLGNQYIQGNNGRMEYFTLNGKYKVISQTATTINVEIGGEPVSMMKAFATIK